MTAVIETTGQGKRYRRVWALADCTLSIPAGHVVGLVGPNGAGKATLLSLAAGLMEPTMGMIEVLGGPPPASPAQLARVGFLARDAPLYAGSQRAVVSIAASTASQRAVVAIRSGSRLSKASRAGRFDRSFLI